MDYCHLIIEKERQEAERGLLVTGHGRLMAGRQWQFLSSHKRRNTKTVSLTKQA